MTINFVQRVFFIYIYIYKRSDRFYVNVMQEIWWKIFNYTHRLVGNGILFDIVFNGQFGLYLLQVTGLLVFVMSLCHVSYCFSFTTFM